MVDREPGPGRETPPGGAQGAARGEGPPAPPQYRRYRAGPRILDRFRGPQDLEALRRRTREEAPEAPPRRPRRVTPGRVAKWLALAVLGWLLLSVVIFFVSAGLQRGVSPATEQALDPGSSLLTGSTVLVLGSDQRSPGTKEPGAGGPSRSDSILLVRGSIGQVRRLSILRDAYAEIPGDRPQKINAAYAIGGPALTVKTVERFLGNGLTVNHVIEVNFADFPDFIDALGGIDVELERCISSPPFSGRAFRLRAGEHHLNGKRALAFARVRKNRCAPNEGDEARAARQQQVIGAIRSRLFSPAAFVRLPWIAWQAPRTIRTDLAGPGLLALFLAVATGGTGEARVTRSVRTLPDGSEFVPPDERLRAVRHLRGVEP